jgi:hypothetical protein
MAEQVVGMAERVAEPGRRHSLPAGREVSAAASKQGVVAQGAAVRSATWVPAARRNKRVHAARAAVVVSVAAARRLAAAVVAPERGQVAAAVVREAVAVAAVAVADGGNRA